MKFLLHQLTKNQSQIWRITQPMFDFAKKEVIEFIPAFIIFPCKVSPLLK